MNKSNRFRSGPLANMHVVSHDEDSSLSNKKSALHTEQWPFFTLLTCNAYFSPPLFLTWRVANARPLVQPVESSQFNPTEFLTVLDSTYMNLLQLICIA